MRFAMLLVSALASTSALALPPKPSAIAKSARRLFSAPLQPRGATATAAAATAPSDPALQGLLDGTLLRVRGGETLFEKYDNQMTKRPILTKMWTSFFIGAFGDVLSQVLGKTSGVDAYRVVTYGLSQLLYFGPVMHYWFQIVDAFGKLPVFDDKPQNVKTLAMTLFDQTIGAVLVVSGFFVFFTCWSAVLDGTFLSTGLPKLLSLGFAKVAADLWPTLIANWKLWPPANFINFRFVPLNYRVLFTNMVAVIWNIYLSAMVRS